VAQASHHSRWRPKRAWPSEDRAEVLRPDPAFYKTRPTDGSLSTPPPGHAVREREKTDPAARILVPHSRSSAQPRRTQPISPWPRFFRRADDRRSSPTTAAWARAEPDGLGLHVSRTAARCFALRTATPISMRPASGRSRTISRGRDSQWRCPLMSFASWAGTWQPAGPGARIISNIVDSDRGLQEAGDQARAGTPRAPARSPPGEASTRG